LGKYQSPCLSCGRVDEDKSQCSEACERLKEFLDRPVFWGDYPTAERGGEVSELESPKKVCKTPDCEREGNFGGYCAPCAARRANSVRWSPGGRAKRPRKERPPKGTTPGPGPSQETAVTVDFKGYESLLEDIRAQAEEQLRPLENQILWIVKLSLGNATGP
jgi:hypothetical protein